MEGAALLADGTVIPVMNMIPDNGMYPDIHHNVTLTDPGFEQNRPLSTTTHTDLIDRGCASSYASLDLASLRSLAVNKGSVHRIASLAWMSRSRTFLGRVRSISLPATFNLSLISGG